MPTARGRPLCAARGSWARDGADVPAITMSPALAVWIVEAIVPCYHAASKQLPGEITFLSVGAPRAEALSRSQIRMGTP